MTDLIPLRPVGRVFALTPFVEAGTCAGLRVGMYPKYVTETTEVGVQIFEQPHGYAFITYVVITITAVTRLKWRWYATTLAPAAAIPPLVTIPVKMWRRRSGRLSTDRVTAGTVWQAGLSGPLALRRLSRAPAAQSDARAGMAYSTVRAGTAGALLQRPGGRMMGKFGLHALQRRHRGREIRVADRNGGEEPSPMGTHSHEVPLGKLGGPDRRRSPIGRIGLPPDHAFAVQLPQSGTGVGVLQPEMCRQLCRPHTRMPVDELHRQPLQL